MERDGAGLAMVLQLLLAGGSVSKADGDKVLGETLGHERRLEPRHSRHTGARRRRSRWLVGLDRAKSRGKRNLVGEGSRGSGWRRKEGNRVRLGLD